MKKSLLLLPIFLLLASCTIEKSYEHVEYCLYEVSCEYEWTQFSDFEENCYYKEINFFGNSREQWTKGVKSVCTYEIDVLNDEKYTIDVWLCGIAFNTKGKNKYKPSECVWVDCDWLYSIHIETTLIGERD